MSEEYALLIKVSTDVERAINALDQTSAATAKLGSESDVAKDKVDALKKKVDDFTPSTRGLITGLSGVATAAWGLYQGYDRLIDTQVSVDKAMLSAKSTANSAEDAQTRYNAVVAKFGAASDQATAALKDLEIAQERATVAQDRADMVAGNLKESYVGFALMVIPASITMIDGLGRTMKNLGMETTVSSALASVAGTAWGVLTGKIALTTVATGIMTAAQGALNAIMAINPIYLVIMALAALAIGLKWAYDNVEPFRNAVDALGRILADRLKPILDMIGGALQKVGDFWNWLTGQTKAANAAQTRTIEENAQKQLAALDECWSITEALAEDSYKKQVDLAAKAWLDKLNVEATGFDKVIEEYGKHYDKLETDISSALDAQLGDIKSSYDDQKSAIEDALETQLAAVNNIYDDQTHAVKNALNTQLDAVKDALSAQLDSVDKAYQDQTDAIKEKLSTALDTIRDSYRTQTDVVKAAADAEIRATQNKYDKLIEASQMGLDTVKETYKNQTDSIKAEYGKQLDDTAAYYNKLIGVVEGGLSEITGARRKDLDELELNFLLQKEAADNAYASGQLTKEQYEKTISDLEKTYNTTRSAKSQDYRIKELQYEEAHAGELEALQAKKKDAVTKIQEEENAKLRSLEEAYMSSEKAAKAELEALKKEQSNALVKIKDEENAKLKTLDDWQYETQRSMKAVADALLETMETQHISDVETLKKTAADQLVALETAHNIKIEALKKAAADQIAALEAKQAADEQQAKGVANAQMNLLEGRRKTDIGAIRAEMKAMEDKFQADLIKLEADKAAERNAIVAKAEDDKKVIEDRGHADSLAVMDAYRENARIRNEAMATSLGNIWSGMVSAAQNAWNWICGIFSQSVPSPTYPTPPSPTYPAVPQDGGLDGGVDAAARLQAAAEAAADAAWAATRRTQSEAAANAAALAAYADVLATSAGGLAGGEAAAQHGFEGLVTKPTRILVGEAGREWVSVTPMGRGGGGGGGADRSITFNFTIQGNADEATARLAADLILRQLRKY
jgi:hypothetical protein